MTESTAITTVWIVTKGSYSDERVWAVFATEEEALRVKSLDGEQEYGDESNDPFPALVVGDAGQPLQSLHLSCRCGANGKLVEQERLRNYWPGLGDAGEGAAHGFHDDLEHVLRTQSQYPSLGHNVAFVWGDDHDRVRKVYSEHKAEGLATLDLAGVSWSHD